jgi:hypothetical protein
MGHGVFSPTESVPDFSRKKKWRLHVSQPPIIKKE